MKDKTYKSMGVSPNAVNDTLRNHTIYLQACVNYIGQQLGWRWYARLGFFTALSVGAFREEIVGLYFLFRSLAS